MNRVREQIGVNRKEVSRYTGKHITIGVLDSGIYPHPDFENRIKAFYDFTGAEKTKPVLPYDTYGHGTHVCGIAGGSGKVSGGKIRGVAPGCNLVVGKVLDHQGAGDVDDLCLAILWMIHIKDRFGIRILNISIGIEDILIYQKAALLKNTLRLAWQSGLVVVVSAGNSGPASGSISDIGEVEEVITVGCHDKDYISKSGRLCEMYSSRGNVEQQYRKPDIVAPGTDILSCSHQYKTTHRRNKHAYSHKSGTSMAAPIVAGAVALMLERDPSLSNDEVKKRILLSATDLNRPWYVQGYGFLNVYKAVFYR